MPRSDMGLNDRLFEPPAADAEKVEARLARLAPDLWQLIQRAGRAIDAGDLATARSALAHALERAPTQPDVLRLYGLLLGRLGNVAAARANFEAALRAVPDDAMTYTQYAQVCEAAGDLDGALAIHARAVAAAPRSPLAFASRGECLASHGDMQAALPALERAVELAPAYAPAWVKLGSTRVACGLGADGAAAIRRALACQPAFGAAWLALADVKAVPITPAEIAQMRGVLAGHGGISAEERTAIEYALAVGLEQAGAYAEAFGMFCDANARRQLELPPWDLQRFLRLEHAADAQFNQPRVQATDTALGREVIFIVGLPRSGSTLVEQVLGAHPDVHAAGELAALPQVLTEESARRRQFYPDWVAAADSDDWQRLGRRYLELTQQFRGTRRRSTDKLPTNWRALGAIRAMLPGAHVVVCRRDPVENCWSCFKQYFPTGCEYANDLQHLGVFWQAFDRAAAAWLVRAPEHVRAQRYEALTERPESEIRALLEFCGLPFDAACLQPHALRRSINTLSAAQVHEPVHRHRDLAAKYGVLLDPLRRALGRGCVHLT
ncbi:MAG TPA: sulfotransferase [Rhodanobacteraceae bacterium]